MLDGDACSPLGMVDLSGDTEDVVLSFGAVVNYLNGKGKLDCALKKQKSKAVHICFMWIRKMIDEMEAGEKVFPETKRIGSFVT